MTTTFSFRYLRKIKVALPPPPPHANFLHGGVWIFFWNDPIYDALSLWVNSRLSLFADVDIFIILVCSIQYTPSYVTTLFLAWEPRFRESWANRLSSWCMTASLPGQKEDSDVINERVYCSMVWHRNIYCVCFTYSILYNIFLYLCNCISIFHAFFHVH
jgi:hypothetical protein